MRCGDIVLVPHQCPPIFQLFLSYPLSCVLRPIKVGECEGLLAHVAGSQSAVRVNEVWLDVDWDQRARHSTESVPCIQVITE
jgi:hypothetical protein